MDFPKSVPGVGLVGGQFADEDPAIGRQGSLISSAWGNAVTQELLNVIQASGQEPDEARADQLLEAIRTLVPERSAFARVSGTLALPATAFGIYALADGGAAATVTLPSTEDLVDDTELLLFSNHANTATVQVKAVAGQTVQGPAALMGESTAAFMLPAGGDWVRLRSERAQGCWVVAAVGLMGEVLLNRGRIAALENETWAYEDKTAVRTFGATYTNGSKKRKVACGQHVNTTVGNRISLRIIIDGHSIGTPSYGGVSVNSNGSLGVTGAVMFDVPPFKTYSVVAFIDGSAAPNSFYWSEADVVS